MDLRSKQLHYELSTDAEAASTRLAQLNAAALAGDIELPRTSRFIARAYQAVHDSLESECRRLTRGPGAQLKNWLRMVTPEVAAVLALREVIRAFMVPIKNGAVTLQHLAKAVGRLYELEVRIREAEAVNPMYMQKVTEQIRDRNTKAPHHIRAVYSKAYKSIMKGELDSHLTDSEAIHLGKFGVQAVMDSGLLTVEHSVGATGKLVTYHLDPEVFEYLTGYDATDVRQVMSVGDMAMLAPPDPWTNLKDGGYYSDRRKELAPLMSLRGIRPSERSRLRAEFTAQRMPLVFATANYLQGTRFTLHRPTVEAIRRVWDQGGGVLGVPTQKMPEKPVCPLPEAWIPAEGTEEERSAFRNWKGEAVQYYESLRVWRGKLRELSGFVRAVDKGTEDMWFPVFMDTRGRWYYRGSPNPQGSDMSKASLHFSERKPLGREGLFWLKVHIANSAGQDKERLVDRAHWTTTNWAAIERALDAPEDYPEVWGTDAPWCMFSAAWELREAYRSGSPETYCTGVPCHMDATCSGLQHFSAMLRDPVGGKYVNLYDDTLHGPKQDIYSRVATLALESAKLDAESTDPEVREQALYWISTGIPRGMAKKPVMTYVYGATLLGTVNFCEQYVRQEMDVAPPPAQASTAYYTYIARKLFAGIAGAVPAAAAAMQWLKEVSRQMPKGRRMEWRTPSGFLVQHDYRSWDETRVRVRSCGVDTIVVREWNDDTKPVQMANAIAPNFVHSLDASHLTLTARDMEKEQLSMVAIHDSFGTHMCDVPRMQQILRNTFVELYSDRDLMVNFLWEVGGVGEPPIKGTLDLERVKTSEFFFC